MNDDDPIDVLTRAELLEMTVEIVSAYVGNNATDASALPGLIQQVHDALARISGDDAAEPEPEALAPAVPIEKSVRPDYIVCLEDGRKFKVLTRYIRTRYDMSPDEYRAKWGLPPSYPMVAPSYSKARSDFARTIGLGRKTKS